MEKKHIIRISPLEVMLGTMLAGIITNNPDYISVAVAMYQSFYYK